MTDQLELLSPVPVEPGVRLTERQRFALELIGRLQPVASDEIGAHLCQRRGKHPADRRCEWDGQSGKEVGAALRKKGLVKFSRLHEGWTLPDYRPVPGSSPQSEGGNRTDLDEHGFPVDF